LGTLFRRRGYELNGKNFRAGQKNIGEFNPGTIRKQEGTEDHPPQNKSESNAIRGTATGGASGPKCAD